MPTQQAEIATVPTRRRFKTQLFHALDDGSLDDVLAGVSRSFYLSLALLPRQVRQQLSLAYLIARAADTLADSEVLPLAERTRLLGLLRGALSSSEQRNTFSRTLREHRFARSRIEAENTLLERTPELLERYETFGPFDYEATRQVLDTLIDGMLRDQAFFDGPLRVLPNMQALDEYTYFAAGCVGEYWTKICMHHVAALDRKASPEHIEWGLRLGKGLQYVNVIRDISADLKNGRCYWPLDLLESVGLTPQTICDGTRGKRAIAYLRDVALSHFDAGWQYILALPKESRRLRVVALLPLWIGLETLWALDQAAEPIAKPVKVSRRLVYRLMSESCVSLISEATLKRLHHKRRHRAWSQPH